MLRRRYPDHRHSRRAGFRCHDCNFASSSPWGILIPSSNLQSKVNIRVSGSLGNHCRSPRGHLGMINIGRPAVTSPGDDEFVWLHETRLNMAQFCFVIGNFISCCNTAGYSWFQVPKNSACQTMQPHQMHGPANMEAGFDSQL